MVTLELDSLGIADNESITGLDAGKKYIVTVDGSTYGVMADGTLGAEDSEPEELIGTEITGLDNSKTYDVQEFEEAVEEEVEEGPTEVTITGDSLGIAGDGVITGLTSGIKYVVMIDGQMHGILADGTVGDVGSSPEELIGTEITGLDNTVTYNVQEEGYDPILSTVPVVQWFSEDNEDQVNRWDLGTVDAGNDPSTTETTFLIWNNREGNHDRSAMTNTVITTKDPTGNMLIPIVKETWIEAKCDSLAETDFTPIGAVEAVGDPDLPDGTLIPIEHPLKATGELAEAGEILGIANDGSLDDAKDNYSKVTLRVAVPATAVAGNVNFLVRVIYEHI